jgi:5'-nucleotidase/UDP-sugar diphosphatase
MRRSQPTLTLALALACALACSKAAPKTAATPVDAGPPPPPPEVTLLITGDENGSLLAEGEQGKEKGGAAETLGRWTANEGHCDGALGPDGAAPTPGCGTLALSTGDHGPGPAISSLFYGEPIAQAMKQMGYAASALGKHELDFGKERFLKARDVAGFPYVAANLKVKDDSAKDLDLPPFKIFKRRGFNIAVVGLVNITGPTTTMPGRFDGLTVTPYEDALATAVPKAWEAGADAVVILADVCPVELKSILEKHADWKVSLAAAGHCHDHADTQAGQLHIPYVGRRFEQYAVAKLTFDPKKPAKDRLVSVDVEHKEVAAGTSAPNPSTALAINIDSWKKKLDALLGEKIGRTKSGLAMSSPDLAKWIATAWRDSLHADVAVLNQKGLRQDLPPGDITKSSVYDVLPFDNSLFLMKIKGADLLKELANKNAVYAGAKKAGTKFKDAKGKPFDPKKVYTVVTADFLYFGGDGFHFAKDDPNGVETGMSWQTPVIEWTKKQATTPAAPLEKKLK